MIREGNGTPPQCSCLENPMDGGSWWAAVHGVAKSQTRLSDFTFTFRFHELEKKMATHSSVLAWRIPGTGEPGGLPSTGSHRVGHDWSDLAAARTMMTMPTIERDPVLKTCITSQCLSHNALSLDLAKPLPSLATQSLPQGLSGTDRRTHTPSASAIRWVTSPESRGESVPLGLPKAAWGWSAVCALAGVCATERGRECVCVRGPQQRGSF